nr:glycosyltransferase [Pectobacterium colocasium]
MHLHSTFAGVICRLLLPLIFIFYRPRVIYSPHAFSFMMKTSKIKIIIYAITERCLQIMTDKIICVSQFEFEQGVEKGLSRNLMTVIYNSVEEPLPIDSVSCPYKEKNKINLLFVGRLDYQKGFDLLIKLANILDDKYHITVIGDGVHSSFDKENTRNITYKGWLDRESIVPYFLYGDVLVMPSRWESFGLSAVEAQSYGMPVIAANNSSLPEVVMDKKTGYLFSSDNIEEVKVILEKLSKDDFKKMGHECKVFYQENFKTEVMCSSTLACYK